MTDNVSKLPTPGVILDLDLEAEAADRDKKAPFVFKLGGREIEMQDPADVDWRELSGINEPGDLFRVALTREDRRFLIEQKLPMKSFNKLVEAYSDYYDLAERVREANLQARFNS